MSRNSEELSRLTPLGWREWVSFPEWGIDFIKAKVDTGAKTSSLHAEDLCFLEEDGVKKVRFSVYPRQNNNGGKKTVTAELLAFRNVRSSSGCLEKRPVVLADINVAGKEFKTELTLTNRELMGFRMLLGRAALDNGFSVITGRSYLGIRAPGEIRKLNSGGDRKK